MTSLTIDILMSLQSKDDLFENFFTIDKIYFAFVSLNNTGLQLQIGSVSKIGQSCKGICVPKFEPMLEKYVLSPSVISSSLFCLFLSIN